MDKDEALLSYRIAQFWLRIDRSGGPCACWIWSGPPVKSTGYGQCVAIRGLPASPPRGITTPHRQAWIITHGDPGTHVTPKGKTVTNRIRHRCPGGPNKLCCNPTHLAVGTDKANADDRAVDGNTFRGEQVTIAKLTDAAVEAALLAHADGASIYSLADQYGVAQATMASAIHGDTWAHVAPHIPRPARLPPIGHVDA